jgi:type I restriction enzyme S subunit
MQTLKLTKKYETYPEYKDSGVEWLGKIPKDWEIKKLKNNFNFEKGKRSAIFTQEYIGSEKNIGVFPVYSGQTENEGVMGSINTFEYNLTDSAIFVTTVGAKAMTPLVLNGKFNLSQNCLLMVSKNNKIDSRFYYYQLFSLFKKMKDEIPSHMQPSLRVSDMNKASVAHVSFGEQVMIANYLDEKTACIDQIIEKKQNQIELLKEKRTAIINHAVTKGLDPKVELVESGIDWIGKIPKGWEVKKLKFLGEAIIGLTYSPEELVDENGTLVLRSSNVQQDKIVLNDNVYVNKKILEKLITRVGDILICSRNGSRALIGKNAVIDKESAGLSFGAFMTIFRTKHSRFISCFLKSNLFMSQLSTTLTSTINQLTTHYLNNIVTVVPPEKEQEKIALYLKKKIDEHDKAIKHVESSIEKLQELKSSLISNVVTGKIKI